LPDAAHSCFAIEVLPGRRADGTHADYRSDRAVIFSLQPLHHAPRASSIDPNAAEKFGQARRSPVGPRFVFERELERGDLVELGSDSGFQYQCWS